MPISRHRRETTLALLCLAPATLLLLAVFLYPIVSTLIDSVWHVSPLVGRTTGPTLDNWRKVLADSEFTHGALPRTIVWTIGVVSGTILLSLPAALLLHQPFRGRRLARSVLILPWAVPLPVAAIVWKFILDGQLGTLNALLAGLAGLAGSVLGHLVPVVNAVTERLGIPVMVSDLYVSAASPVWLADATTAFPALMWVGIWASIPFTTVTLLAGLQGIGAEVLEAAALDGATGWAGFRGITLPLLRPVLNVAVVLNAIYVFNSFPIIWVLTKGGPARTTDTIITLIYREAFLIGSPGPAQALGVMSFALLMAFSTLYLRLAEGRAS